jgi:cytoskeleton protein RodZ
MNEMTRESQAEAPETEAPPPPDGPGILLRQARERAGFALEDVAGQTNLSRSTLEALEKDDFALLSEPVYVRGYYRKLAKVLPVGEAELLEAYARRAHPQSTPLPQRIPLAGGVAAGTAPRYRGQGIGIVVTVVVVIGLLFLLSDRSTRDPAPYTPRAGSGLAPVTAPEDEPAMPEPTMAQAEPAAAPGPAAPAVPNQLVLEFGQSSFVRVEDNRGRTLAIGLVRAGERQVHDGQPPYTVFLGNARQVRVYYGGQAVDFSRHLNQESDTARFSVP